VNRTDTARIETLGDDALLLCLGEGIDVALNVRVHALAARLRGAGLPGLLDLVPAYASLLLRFDPLRWQQDRLCELMSDDAEIVELSESSRGTARSASERRIEIPVCYGGEFGPDLAKLADNARIDIEAAIQLHTGAEYHVAMLGFAPGFPYLLGLPPALHAPRRAEPRMRVAAGSVAIGGAQTGIYPRELPGGWQLIGRTPRKLFDVDHDLPTLLAPGDRVRFRAIDSVEFDALERTKDLFPGR